MRLHLSLDSWRFRLLAALALLPAAGCDSTVEQPPAPIACANPQPQYPGLDTGVLTCDGGWMHRVEAKACPNTLGGDQTCAVDPMLDACASDADCAAQPYGYCQSDFGEGCSCHYGCVVDSDCGAGEICLCYTDIGQCVSAGCTTDADCETGLCAVYHTNPYCGSTGFACQSPDDECAGDADCGGNSACAFEDGRRVCTDSVCQVGRPFLVEGAERLAEAAARGDWRAAGLAPELAGLDAATCAALAAHWTQAGLMEHASVAAFARFALQLLAQGAPPDLLRETQAAMADETEHAALCFALASAYAGRGIGPGPLSIAGALEGSDARSTLLTAIREGCVGETVAAIEAAEAAQRALDPAVRGALERIAADEVRHAELSWLYVRWALEQRPELRADAAAEIAAVIAEARAAGRGNGGDEALLVHGVVTEPLRREIRRRALEQVIQPCAAALLASLAAQEGAREGRAEGRAEGRTGEAGAGAGEGEGRDSGVGEEVRG